MADEDLHRQIDALASEEHALRQANASHPLSKEDRARLHEVENALDRSRDLLRQRNARHDAGLNPGDAKERPESVVEGYLQ